MANKMFFKKNPSITIQLERLQSTYDGTSQLREAIARVIRNWNDVWGHFSINISDAIQSKDWEAEEVVAQVKKGNLPGLSSR